MPQAKLFRIMVSRHVFYLPELITFFVQNHQVTHEIPPGDAERPLRHLWLRACTKCELTSCSLKNVDSLSSPFRLVSSAMKPSTPDLLRGLKYCSNAFFTYDKTVKDLRSC